MREVFEKRQKSTHAITQSPSSVTSKLAQWMARRIRAKCFKLHSLLTIEKPVGTAAEVNIATDCVYAVKIGQFPWDWLEEHSFLEENLMRASEKKWVRAVFEWSCVQNAAESNKPRSDSAFAGSLQQKCKSHILSSRTWFTVLVLMFSDPCSHQMPIMQDPGTAALAVLSPAIVSRISILELLALVSLQSSCICGKRITPERSKCKEVAKPLSSFLNLESRLVQMEFGYTMPNEISKNLHSWSKIVCTITMTGSWSSVRNKILRGAPSDGSLSGVQNFSEHDATAAVNATRTISPMLGQRGSMSLWRPMMLSNASWVELLKLWASMGLESKSSALDDAFNTGSRCLRNFQLMQLCGATNCCDLLGKTICKYVWRKLQEEKRNVDIK